MDFRQSGPFAGYLKASGWKIEKTKNGTYLYIFKIPSIGSILRIPRPKPPIPFVEIIKIAKKNNAFAIKIEPDALIDNKKMQKKLKEWGFVIDNWSIEPTRTLIIDLNLKKNQIFSAFKSKWRQNIRFAQKNNVYVKQEEDIDTLIRHWQQNARNKRHLIEKPAQTRTIWNEFRKRNSAFILISYVNKNAIASALLIFWGKTAHLWHLGYSGKYKQLKPLYLLVWESILFAKNKEMERFDFEGIEDSHYPYSKKTQATYFKKGFGGKDLEYLGSFIKFYNPFANLVYRIVSRINPGLFRLFFKSKPPSF